MSDGTAALVAHIPSLRRYARALTGDAWLADDLVQDTLERACDKWRLWTAGTDLRAWLFTLMHNLFANQVRRTPSPHAALDVDELAAFRSRAPGMPFAHPTVEHFTPLFVTLGAATDPAGPVTTAIDGYMMGLAKRSFQTA